VGRTLEIVERRQNLSGREITERQAERYPSHHRREDKRDRFKGVRNFLGGQKPKTGYIAGQHLSVETVWAGTCLVLEPV
jgi:hypothetical protein